MAAPAKQSSRWGNLLQQAVAGVESRLDNILAEGAEEPGPRKAAAPTTTSTGPAKTESGVARTASTNRANDRLQERLARAIAAKNSAQNQKGEKEREQERRDSLALSSGPPSRTGSPATVASSPRQSIDVPTPAPVPRSVEKDDAKGGAVADENGEGDVKLGLGNAPSTAVEPGAPVFEYVVVAQAPDISVLKTENEASPRPSGESTRSSVPRISIDSTKQPSLRPSMETSVGERLDISESASKPTEDYEALYKQLQADHEASELQRQEEVHGYIERIDALQSKLQYLAKEGAEAARKASEAAPNGTLEKKLADKEEQVALLMEEGQKLSKKELNQLTTIKKLRAKIQEDTKTIEEAKQKQAIVERDVLIMTERLKRAEAFEKRLGEKEREFSLLRKDLETLKSANEIKDAAIIELEAELDEAIAQGKEAEMKAANEALEAEQKRAKDLEDDIANLKIEKNLLADRSQAQIKELREKAEKDAERARMVELEMKNEQQMLESKLEAMRARSEEVSSGATGDAQAKLLRQIETLQTQYAIANENWQGIEASLIARATSLEKERDEATKRETDIRRKAREVTLKAKQNEDELEESRSKMPTLQQELAEQKAKIDTLQQRAEAAEAALIEARASFEQEKLAWKSELQNRIDEDRQKETQSLYSRAGSPVASTRRGLTSEYLGLQNIHTRRPSRRSINNDPLPSATLPRRSSVQPLARTSGNGTPRRQESMLSLKERSDENDVESPSVHTDRDSFFEQNISPSSPYQTINDIVSVSTAGAGPSVQLVERMSSAVRRLENEKVATKEDISRLAAQRDEARAEIVVLMREVEGKRAVDARVKELESEVEVLNERYQTTLEMLGEKSELVDELRSDVGDLKDMYRELLLRTVK
ncbi:M protein repeat protein [Diplocarpon rosae]|nr:M protein repeat protein [Diplocarpon rosae]